MLPHCNQDGTIPLPPSLQQDEVQAVGCGDPTFTGAGFDLVEVSLNAVRLAIATLCSGHQGGYPEADWDVLTIAFRDEDGRLVPTQTIGHILKKHPACPSCGLK